MKLVHVDNGVLVLDESKALAHRLRTLFDLLGAVLEAHRPNSAAMEGVFQHRNARSALVLGHARGVALLVLSRAGLDVGEYTPQQVKKAASGAGRAEKSQIQQVVTQRLDLPEPPQEDAADALAVALCHAQHLAFPAAVSLPPQPSRRAGHKRSEAALRALVLAQSKPKKPGGAP
ncbi:MAG: crossover junction endodeoxyribonuclease RuvC [Bradymonadia bacterium]|jgi:crossover junction endodeoxyribonuclease RuvC